MPQQTPAALGPILVHTLGLSGAELGLLTSAIWGGMLFGMLPFGILIDRFGERWRPAPLLVHMAKKGERFYV